MTDTTLSEAHYRQLRRHAQVLEADGYGDKVLLLADGRMLKLFRLRRALSSARLCPYHKRFASNAALLQKLRIPTVSHVEGFKLPSQKRTGVLYQPLPGETVRRLGVAGALTASLCGEVGAFLARLHAEGILFRSVHLGNIVRCDNGEPGLIDIADLSHRPWPLTRSERLRNFQHLFRPAEDHDYLTAEHKRMLIDRYLQACPPKLAARPGFRRAIEQRARLSA